MKYLFVNMYVRDVSISKYIKFWSIGQSEEERKGDRCKNADVSTQ